jgi:hypothetical protein
MTNGLPRHGHLAREFFDPESVGDDAVRQFTELPPIHQGAPMQYALLIYGPSRSAAAGRIDGPIAAVLARPNVTAWARLHAGETATTVRGTEDEPLLTDGPFIETKELLVGLIMIEADNLDDALGVARELEEARSIGGAIEVRPVREGAVRGA